jgi:ectoine hydroxylase-related dioxygenase (phytanoyl-CoA dioxygenase family)
MEPAMSQDYASFAEQRIGAEQIDRFERDGAIILRDVIDASWIERMRDAIDRVLQQPSQFASEMAAQSTGGRFYGDFFLWRTNSEFRAFLFESPLAELAQRIMRSNTARFFYEQLLVKEPGTGSVTPWHQDLPYWPVAGWQIVSIWVPFDRATPENGVVTYVKGSHLWGKLFKPRSFGTRPPNLVEDGLTEAPDIDARPQDFEFVTGVLNPGDVFVHHARTLHGAPGNASPSARRRALATRWCGDDVLFEERPNHFLGAAKFSSLRPLAPGKSGDSLDCELFPLITPRAYGGYLPRGSRAS